jgi:hypothetical protein
MRVLDRAAGNQAVQYEISPHPRPQPSHGLRLSMPFVFSERGPLDGLLKLSTFVIGTSRIWSVSLRMQSRGNPILRNLCR